MDASFCFIPYLHRTSSYPRYELAPLFLLRLRRVQFRLVLLSIHSCDHVLHATATDTCRHLVALSCPTDHVFHVFKHENDSLNGSSSVFPQFSSRLPRPRVFSFTSLATYCTHFRPKRRCARASEPPSHHVYRFPVRRRHSLSLFLWIFRSLSSLPRTHTRRNSVALHHGLVVRHFEVAMYIVTGKGPS